MDGKDLVFNLLVWLPAHLFKEIRLGHFLESFEESSIEWSQERIHFCIHFLRSKDDLRTAVARLAHWKELTFSIVISDQLTVLNSNGKLEASEFARELRTLYFNSLSYCGLIALHSESSSRASDIDFVLPVSALTLTKVLEKHVLRVAHRLWYKAPPTNKNKTVELPLVTTDINSDQFGKCLELRYQVYNLLGYIDKEVEASQLKIEMDFFDPQAVHLAAFQKATGVVMGTARLIVPGNSPLRADVKFLGESYCREWAKKEPQSVFRKRLDQGPAASMPIFDTFPFPATYKKQLRPLSRYCELSRVIVGPLFRGRGVGSSLIKCALTFARSLDRKVMVLECAPHHRKMYEEYGFGVIIKGEKIFYSRARELDQMALAMANALTDEALPWTVAGKDKT